MSLEKEGNPPIAPQNQKKREEHTKRLGMSGRGNYGADKPPASSQGEGKGAQHHRSNKAGKPSADKGS